MNDYYEIKIDFKRNSSDPARVFKAMSEMIESFADIDKNLINSFASYMESQLILEDIEIGSIRAKLRTMLHAINDDALNELDWKKAVGHFLVKGKKRILEWLKDKTEVTSIEQVKDIENQIEKVAEETTVNKLPFYSSIPSKKLLENISKLYDAVNHLAPEDSAYYITNEGEVMVAQGVYVNSESIEKILTKEVIRSEVTMILKVKKPDYLGFSKWDFQHNQKTIQVKILDSEWLNRFQSREIDLKPGDSIRALVRTDLHYGFDNSVIAEHYYIVKVIEILESKIIFSQSLFNLNNLDIDSDVV